MRRGGWRVLLIGVLIVGVSSPCFAGAMYRNDSGAVARAVRIEFSEPAEITSTDRSFPERNPQGPSTVIGLSGGGVPAGGWITFSWRPDTARVVKVEWLARPPSASQPSASRLNLRFTNPKAKPEVHGDLLNPASFAHPAYVTRTGTRSSPFRSGASPSLGFTPELPTSLSMLSPGPSRGATPRGVEPRSRTIPSTSGEQPRRGTAKFACTSLPLTAERVVWRSRWPSSATTGPS